MQAGQLTHAATEQHQSFEAALDNVSEKFEMLDQKICEQLDSRRNHLDKLFEAIKDELSKSRILFVKPYSTTELDMRKSKEFLHNTGVSIGEVIMSSARISQQKQAWSSKNWSPTNTYRCKQLVDLLAQKLPVVIAPSRIRNTIHTSVVPTESVNESALLWIRSSFYPITREPTSINRPTRLYGKQAQGTGFFNRPKGMCIHPMSGEVYVCNKFKDRIDIFSRDLTHIRHFNPLPSGRGNMEYPDGIAVASDGTSLIIYDGKTAILADAEHKRVPISASTSQFSSFHEEIHQIACVAVDPDDNFYLADIHKQRVFVIDTLGNIQKSFPFPKHTRGITNFIISMAFNEKRELMMLQKNPTILHFVNSTGELLRSLNLKLSGDMVLSRSANGGFLICNYSESIIQFFSESGHVVHELKEDYYRAAVFGNDGSFYMLNSSEGSLSKW